MTKLTFFSTESKAAAYHSVYFLMIGTFISSGELDQKLTFLEKGSTLRKVTLRYLFPHFSITRPRAK